MAKNRAPSIHSRAARRATSPSINTDKTLKETPLPRSVTTRASVLAIHQSAGVQKKTRAGRKSRMSTKARRRHDKGLEMAEAVGDRTAAKTSRSLGRARVARDRRKPWDHVNKVAKADEHHDGIVAGDGKDAACGDQGDVVDDLSRELRAELAQGPSLELRQSETEAQPKADDDDEEIL
ncbi:hypothetical protein XA68_11790 [Ophiocordyceps unilateralis]|uniref:Ribosome biogenesis protein Alb1 n=1 Tax=Ophiocordyceps unilateralis TaxID=268505 RepID=A0A2A9PFP6_OPHUN|nr:hypothetical protein XA68_11790 [Ophiocordyceps unilateralis]